MRPLPDLFPEWPSDTKMSPLGAIATPVGRSNVTGPVPATPGVPIVIRTFPSGLSLRTVWPVFGTVGSSLVSVVQIFPSRSTVNPCGWAKRPAPKLLSNCARGIELEDRRIRLAAIQARGVAVRLIVEAPMEHPDVAAGRDVHADDFSPLPSARSLHAGRQRRPVGIEPIRIGKRGLGDWRIGLAVDG